VQFSKLCIVSPFFLESKINCSFGAVVQANPISVVYCPCSMQVSTFLVVGLVVSFGYFEICSFLKFYPIFEIQLANVGQDVIPPG
jgi:hypothetical protein